MYPCLHCFQSAAVDHLSTSEEFRQRDLLSLTFIKHVYPDGYLHALPLFLFLCQCLEMYLPILSEKVLFSVLSQVNFSSTEPALAVKPVTFRRRVSPADAPCRGIIHVSAVIAQSCLFSNQWGNLSCPTFIFCTCYALYHLWLARSETRLSVVFGSLTAATTCVAILLQD